MKHFAYDVAFSFLDADLAIVRQIVERLEGRLRTFVYTDHQDKLVGTDGQESFRRVFEHDARTVVVLHREDWGRSGMTGIEKLAMKDRGHRELFDWMIVVVLDDARPDSKFIPKTQIYWDYPKYGMDRLIGAIVNHVTRNEGEASEATVDGAMTAAKRAQELEEARRRFLQVRVGSEALHQWVIEGQRFQDLLIKRAKDTSVVPLSCQGEPGAVVTITAPRASLTTTFRPDVEMWIMWCGFNAMVAGRLGRGETKTVEELSCRPDLDPDHRPAWKVGNRWFLSEHLVEHILKKLARHMNPSA